MSAIEAVVFDLDGVLVDSDHVWHEVREGLAHERGGRWSDQSEADMSGMSSTEWSRYLHDVVGISDPPEEINREVVRRMRERYAALLVDAVLGHSGLDEHFEAPRNAVDHTARSPTRP